MVNSIQRLGFSPTGTIEHRKLAVELSEVIIKWELQRIKDESDTQDVSTQLMQWCSKSRGITLAAALLCCFVQIAAVPLGVGVKRPSVDDPNLNSELRKRHASGTSSNIVPTVIPKVEPGSTEPIERAHADTVLNFLLRLACQVSWHHCCTPHTLHSHIGLTLQNYKG
jgi:transformation/transcription domain-associated protein